MKFANDQRGAVLAEFALALMPMLLTFFGFVQFAQLATADLYVRHAAICAARAAAVMQDANNPGEHSPQQSGSEAAAEQAMGKWARSGLLGVPSVSITGGGTSGEFVSATVTVPVTCRVPLGKMLACGGSTKSLSHTARFPAQGARYQE